MAPHIKERPLTAQEAMIRDQRAALTREDSGPFAPDDVAYGPKSVLGFNPDDEGEPSATNVVNSPYLKGLMERGTKVGDPLEAAQLHGFAEPDRANVVDRSGGGAARTEPLSDEAQQELDSRHQELAAREQEIVQAAERVGTAVAQIETRGRELDERERALEERATQLDQREAEAAEAAAAAAQAEPESKPVEPAAEAKPEPKPVKPK